MAKTIRELRGESCIEIEEVTPAKQQIINSRSFGQSVTEIEDLQEAVAHFVTNAAIKLRAQDSVSALLQVFIMTNRFKPNERQYCPSASLRSEEHTSELQPLMRLSYAVFCLKKKNHSSQPTTQLPLELP